MKVAVIGSGFAGILMGIKLKQAGIHDFVIFEKAAQLGGTWRDNIYPGCACDVESHLYSYSFELNPDWTRAFSPQLEIWQYLEHCADKYDVRNHIQFERGIVSAEWSDDSGTWHLQDSLNVMHETQFIASATGGLSIPALPQIDGLGSFQGSAFHTAQYDNSVDLKGKRIGIIGTGASAIQLVPQLAKVASQLHLFQRTPPWVLPKPDFDFSKGVKSTFRKMPALMEMYRQTLYWVHEMFVLGFVFHPAFMKVPQMLAKNHIRRKVKNLETRKQLTPTWTMGCKRVLLSNDYYPAFNQPNVELITQPIQQIQPSGIKTSDGKDFDIDALVYATGFKATEYLSNIKVIGKNGHSLREVWGQCPEGYLGTTISGFPNFFTFTGPNTGLGHSSIIVIMEAQVRYIIDAINKLEEEGMQSADVKKEVQKEYNVELQKTIQKSVWQKGGCKSWYQDETGKNPTLWPGFTFTFSNKTKRFDSENYELKQQVSAKQSATMM